MCIRDRGSVSHFPLDACFRQLAENPFNGKDCSEISCGYRKFNVGSHIIFYRQIISDSIEIVRVLHGHMDVENHLSGLGDVVGFDELIN